MEWSETHTIMKYELLSGITTSQTVQNIYSVFGYAADSIKLVRHISYS